MNRQQVCVHVARNAADRLAVEISAGLPRDVTRAFADADRTTGDAQLGAGDAGYDAPPAQDPASLLAACAIRGTDAVWDDTLGVGTAAELSESELFDAVQGALRHATDLPPLMDETRYDQIVTVVAQEIVATFNRPDVPGGA